LPRKSQPRRTLVHGTSFINRLGGCFECPASLGDRVPERDDYLERFAGHAAVIDALRLRQFFIRDQIGVYFLLVVSLWAVTPAVLHALLGPNLMAVLGQLFEDVIDLLGQLDAGCIDRRWNVFCGWQCSSSRSGYQAT